MHLQVSFFDALSTKNVAPMFWMKIGWKQIREMPGNASNAALLCSSSRLLVGHKAVCWYWYLICCSFCTNDLHTFSLLLWTTFILMEIRVCTVRTLSGTFVNCSLNEESSPWPACTVELSDLTRLKSPRAQRPKVISLVDVLVHWHKDGLYFLLKPWTWWNRW